MAGAGVEPRHDAGVACQRRPSRQPIDRSDLGAEDQAQHGAHARQPAEADDDRIAGGFDCDRGVCRLRFPMHRAEDALEPAQRLLSRR